MLTSQTIEQQNISRPFRNSSPQKTMFVCGGVYFFKIILKKAICDGENLYVLFFTQVHKNVFFVVVFL